ncbi:hypothetical protein GCM10023339_41440 [Alloalcanivorax gelatiniphagus]
MARSYSSHVTSLPDGAAGRGRWRDRRAATPDALPTPPPGYRIVEVNTPSCDALRDVVSRRWDFESARVFCDSYLAGGEADNSTGTRQPSEGLWIAAVVTYGRAFNQGVRNAERVDISFMDHNERGLHDYVIALRNKHFAHSVNRYEEVITLAYLTDSAFESRAATRVGQTHVSVYSARPELAEALSALAAKLVRRCDLRVRTLHKAIGAELAELGLDSVHALPDIQIRAPGPSEVNRRR